MLIVEYAYRGAIKKNFFAMHPPSSSNFHAALNSEQVECMLERHVLVLLFHCTVPYFIEPVFTWIKISCCCFFYSD